jgi:predicted Zn-dependent protease
MKTDVRKEMLLSQLRKDLIQINSTPAGRRVFLKAAPLLLAGCASAKKTRYREGDNTGQETSLTVNDERKMTREYLPKMEKEYPRHPNARVQRYITSLGNDIVAANNLGGKPYNYNFRVCKAKMVNAFALPAGTVFVTAPLIQLAKSEAELAGVVGHEIGHIQARHTAERIDAANKAQTKSILYGIGGAILGGAAGFALGKAVCKKEDKECLRRISMYGAAAGGAGGLLISKFAFMANSREDEMEADRIGFKTSLNAGFHKDHIGLFYNRLLEMEKKHQGKQNAVMRTFADAMSTHPPSEQRVSQMREMASSNRNVGTKVSSREFKYIKKLLS